MTAGEKRELSRLGERGEGGGRKHFEKCVGNRGLLPFPPQEEERRRRGSRSQVFLRGVARDCEFSEVP